MGIFDRWRRRKKQEARSTVRAREMMRTESKPSVPKPKIETPVTPERENEVRRLLAEHVQLVRRKEQLQHQRGELTKRLDDGELTAIEFRKELMAKIQEAAEVSENLRNTSSRLTELGHHGIAS